MSVGLAIFTLFHPAISLLSIGSGMVVVVAVLKRREAPKSTAVLLVTTILASVVGFLSPFRRVLPSDALGVLSLIALAVAVHVLYFCRLDGGWQKAYTVSAVVALYLVVFVLLAQLFAKVPALKAVARTEAPFKLAQSAVLFAFAIVGLSAAKRASSQHALTT
jgi:hypothetical protein